MSLTEEFLIRVVDQAGIDFWSSDNGGRGLLSERALYVGKVLEFQRLSSTLPHKTTASPLFSISLMELAYRASTSETKKSCTQADYVAKLDFLKNYMFKSLKPDVDPQLLSCHTAIDGLLVHYPFDRYPAFDIKSEILTVLKNYQANFVDTLPLKQRRLVDLNDKVYQVVAFILLSEFCDIKIDKFSIFLGIEIRREFALSVLNQMKKTLESQRYFLGLEKQLKMISHSLQSVKNDNSFDLEKVSNRAQNLSDSVLRKRKLLSKELLPLKATEDRFPAQFGDLTETIPENLSTMEDPTAQQGAYDVWRMNNLKRLRR